ncbi:MAG: type II toxin-antitoxin system RelE/ParE family toxin [Pseudomonadota bacterium]
MADEVFRSAECDEDLDIIFEFLMRSYEAVGESVLEAFERAATRLRDIEDDLASLGQVPHQGLLWPEVRPRLRWVTKRRAIFYFEVDDEAKRVNVLAIFFGGQDHRRLALDRVLGLT